MYTLLLVLQVMLAIGLIVLILLQQGKGADAGAAFGSGASSTVFGARGAGNFMSRTSAVLATLFFANSLLLSTPFILGTDKVAASVAEQISAPKAAEEAPAETPAPATAPADLPDVPATPDTPAGSTNDLP